MHRWTNNRATLFQATLTGVLLLVAACGGGGGGGGGGASKIPVATSLTVIPDDAFESLGEQGGPFVPASFEYEVSNDTGEILDWSVAHNSNWLKCTPSNGTLASGKSAVVRVDIKSANAEQLDPENYSDELVFSDSVSVEERRRTVRLSVSHRAPVSIQSAEQFGITWKFAEAVPAGQFVNGDWWVVGPVTIVSISPESTEIGGRTKNGSMINPTALDKRTQGYDSAMFLAGGLLSADYDPTMNVALDVSPSQPLVVNPGSSLVSTISMDEITLPQLRTAAVLTVLDVPATPGSFRPAYSSQDKTPIHHESQLRRNLLPKLAPVGNLPDFDEVAGMFERPWLDHVPEWAGRHHHPLENMSNYGRNICGDTSVGAAMLCLDAPIEDKEATLIGLVQIGIDYYGIVDEGGLANWPAHGGHGSGRKFPILFAGVMLDDDNMSNIGQRGATFGEDGQTFFVEETSPGVINFGFGDYTSMHLGMPEWGYWHRRSPEKDNISWYPLPSNPLIAYRSCCTANSWNGIALLLHALGVQDLWNHDSFFAYLDRYIETSTSNNDESWMISWSSFTLDMWRAHRQKFDWSYEW